MKKILVGLLILGVQVAAAKDIDLGNGEQDRVTGVRLTADGFHGESASIRIDAAVEKLVATTRKTEQGEFTYLAIPGFQQTGDIGWPSLPVMNRLVEVPQGKQLEVKVLSSTRERIDLNALEISAPLFPRQPPQVKDGSVTPFAHDPRAYLAPGFQQEALAQVEDIGMMRDMHLVLLRIAPVAYDPTTGEIEVVNDIELELTVADADMAATAELKKDYHSPFFSPVRKQILTAPSLRELEPEESGKPRSFAIIADRALEAPLAPFVEWKREQGFDVLLAYNDEVGTTPSAVCTWVHGLYTDPGPTHAVPDFLLVVGDQDNLPAEKVGEGWSKHVSDLPFVTVTEGDYLPDILYGRFSARTADELIPQIQKTIEYEKYAFEDPSFLERVVLTAGWDYSHAVEWGYPQINYGIENYFNEEHGITGVSKFLSAGAHQNESEIRTAVASGSAFVNYTAHGSNTSWADPSFTIADVNELTNEGQYPLVLANCCVTSSFQVGTCFGEAWLRAPGKGAIGYIGGSNNTYWDEDLWFGNGFYDIQHPNETGAAPAKEDTGVGAYDAAFEDRHATSGSMIPVGNLAVEASNTSRKLYYWEVYHLFGDPSLQVYWGLPEDNPVQHSGQIVSQGDDGDEPNPPLKYEIAAAPGSYVGLTIGDRLVAAGFVKPNGKTKLKLTDLPATGEARLVITAKGYKPFFDKVTIGEDDDGDDGDDR